ncbi:serine hydrolase [Winogradskyella sp.]|uniref:serine hydrolase n=1 Tax=Winogradskyella sp. TaxID=1883156 RepID=UPI0026237DB4|nr:serine hydrolase [Winogradskyella sp.]
MKKEVLLQLIMVLFVGLSPCQENQMEKIDRINDLLSELNEREMFNGGFMIGTERKILYNEVFGKSDAVLQQNLEVSAKFGIASVNKTLTATLIMKMIELEYLSLDSKLIDFFPNLPYSDITVDHLLTHTSGIPFYYDHLIKNNWDKSNQLTNDKLFSLYEKIKPKQEFPAGTKFSYSNAGYMFLAGIAEKASNKTYDELLEEHLFKPLDMQNTSRLINIDDKDLSLAKGHKLSIKKGDYVPLKYHEDYNSFLDAYFRDRKGAGGLNSTMLDLWKFGVAIKGSKILSSELTKKMLTPTKTSNGKLHPYSKGWQLERTNGKKNIGHRGGSEGENCFFRIALDEDFTYFLVSNYSTPYLSQINEQIKSILKGESVKRIKKSGVEQLTKNYTAKSFDALSDMANKMRKQKEEFYFTLSEFNSVAWPFWLKEDYDTAFDFLNLATIAMPNNAGAWEVLAEAYMERGMNEKAIKYYLLTIKILNEDDSKKGKKWVKEWIVEMNEKIENLKKS